MPYSNGGIKYFEDFNETWPFIQYKMEKVIFNYVRGEQSFDRGFNFVIPSFLHSYFQRQ